MQFSSPKSIGLSIALMLSVAVQTATAQTLYVQSADAISGLQAPDDAQTGASAANGSESSTNTQSSSEHYVSQPMSAWSDPASQVAAEDKSEKRLKDIEKRLNDIDAAKKKLPSVTVNGVFQADSVWFNQPASSRSQYGLIEDGAGFRRARLSAKGSVTDTTNYFMQMDFGFFGRPTFTDVWVEQTKIPYLGTVRVGQWKQPFSLEVVSSFRYTTFMERSLLFQTFTPFRHIGVGFYNNADDLNSTWAMSYFRTGQDQFGDSLSIDGGHGMAARLTRLAWWCDNGSNYLHLGSGYFLNSPPRDRARFRTLPEIFVGEFAPGGIGTSGQAVPGVLNGTPFFADTGVIQNVNAVSTYGLEALWVNGPLSWQSEAMAAQVNQTGVRDAILGGAYSQVGYFLTGEHRPYDRKAGAIDRVLPRANFKPGTGGWGAWEVAGRWSYVDLNAGSFGTPGNPSASGAGGIMQNLTAGLNWFINPYVRWEFNYIHSWVNGHAINQTTHQFDFTRTAKSETNIFGTRVQLDF